VTAFLCPVRKRAGHVGGRPVADYAVNLVALYGDGVPPTAANVTHTLTLWHVADGSSATILAGAKSLHPDDYATAGPAVDDTFLHLSSGGASRVGARYTVGATTVRKELTAPPPADYLFPAAVPDPDTLPGVAADTFGGPSEGRLMLLFLDGHVGGVSYEWMAADRTVALDKPLEWGIPATGTVDRVSQLRAALTPAGGEQVRFE
jgi:prepilin-type processing-associated H-X9-DG protein